MTTRRASLRILLTAAACAGASLTPALAQQSAYPTKAVRMVVPYPPGGATDVIGRLIADKLGTRWGQAVIVDNRAGAGTTVGAENVVTRGKNPFAPSNLNDDEGTVPYVRYEQDL